MAQLKPEQIEEYKAIYKKQYGEDLTDAEAAEQGRRLVSFLKLMIEYATTQKGRERRLEKEPQGFHLDDGKIYSCGICHDSISNRQSWYDKDGLKCMNCQRALDRRVIPKSVCTDRDSWLAGWELTTKYDIHPNTLRKLVRQGAIKVRNITTESGAVHYQVFLKKDNWEFLKEHKAVDKSEPLRLEEKRASESITQANSKKVSRDLPLDGRTDQFIMESETKKRS